MLAQRDLVHVEKFVAAVGCGEFRQRADELTPIISATEIVRLDLDAFGLLAGYDPRSHSQSGMKMSRAALPGGRSAGSRGSPPCHASPNRRG